MVNIKPDTVGMSKETDSIRQNLADKIARLIGAEEDQATAISGLMLYKRTAPTVAGAATYEPSISIVVQGRKRVDLGPTTFIYNASRYLLNSVDLPVLGQVIEASKEKPYLCMVLKLQMPMVREILSRDDMHIEDASSEGPAMFTSENTTEMLDACLRLVDLLDHPKDIPFLSELLQKEIIYRILCGPEGAKIRTIAMQGHQGNRASKAISWIRKNYAKPLQVEMLAEIAGMGVSTLHHHFKALTSLSPLQYQKQVRLHVARNRMLLDSIDAASAAFEVGYESASQFNREYSRYFGQPPMRDIQSLRTL